MQKIIKTPFESFCLGKKENVADGCKLCVKGKKLVLFITGKCSRNCFYCSLSEKRKNIDKIWANERECHNIKGAIEEAGLNKAEGAGITGGNPLVVFSRTIKFAKALKKKFGRNFHIHIYLPTDKINWKNLSCLAKYVDEIRFHPYFLSSEEKLKDDLKKIKLTGLLWNKPQIGCEIPAIPGSFEKVKKFIDVFHQHIGFLNINELELSDTNADFLVKKFQVNKDGYTIKGSREEAIKILRYCARKKLISHFCSAATKNLYQYKNRLKRRAENTKKPFDVLTAENDFLRAALYLPEFKPGFDYREKIKKISKKRKQKVLRGLENKNKILIKLLKINKKLIEIDRERLRILTSVKIAEENAGKIKEQGLVPAIVEELPTFDAFQLQVDWL